MKFKVLRDVLRRDRLLGVLALLLFAGLCVYSLANAVAGDFLEALRALDPRVVLLAVGTQLLSYVARAARLAQCESAIGWRRLPLALRLVLIHNASNLLLPMRSGELSFPWLMQRWFGVDPLQAGGTLLFLRALDVQVLAVLAALAAMLAGAVAPPSDAAFGILMLAALSGPLLLLLLARRMPSRLRSIRILQRLVQGIPDCRRTFCGSLLWTWLAWSLKLTGLAVLFAALAKVSVPTGVLAALGGDASTVLPIHAPGGAGTYEAGALALLAPWMTITPQVVSAIIGLHVFVLGLAVLLGATATFGHGRGMAPPQSRAPAPVTKD